MSNIYREKVYSKRKRLGINVRKCGVPKPKTESYNNVSKAVNTNKFKQFEDNKNKYKRPIKYLNRVNMDNGEQSDYRNDDTDAGDQFGGKLSKRDNNKKKYLFVGLFDIMEWVYKMLLSYTNLSHSLHII